MKKYNDTKILDRLQKKFEKEMLIEGVDVKHVSATELIEAEIKERGQANNFVELFQKLLKCGARKEAEYVAKILRYDYGIEMSND